MDADVVDSPRLEPTTAGPEAPSRAHGSASRQDSGQPWLVSGCELPHHVLVGTHHKTGSVWLKRIFESACRYHRLRFFAGPQTCLPPEWDVFLEDHSAFDFDALPGPYRGVHLIRDPRDVIVSGCYYHQVAEEEWLHRPKSSLGGKTYQQAMLDLAGPDDRLSFEMEHLGRATIEDMLRWDYSRPGILELKYEELIEDTELEGFHRLFTFLGFPGSAIPSLLGFVWQHSIFSGLEMATTHIRSGRKNQWMEHFGARHRRRFVELFGDGLVRLGYEADDAWVETPPLAR